MPDDLQFFLLILIGVFVLLLLFWPRRKPLSGKDWYNDQLRQPEWQQKRLEILRRDNFRCQLCLSDVHLQIHHKSYLRGHRVWEYPDSMLITLCNRCHTLFSRYKS